MLLSSTMCMQTIYINVHESWLAEEMAHGGIIHRGGMEIDFHAIQE